MTYLAKILLLVSLLSLFGGVVDVFMHGDLAPFGISPGSYIRFSMASALVSISILVMNLTEKK